MSSHGAGKNNHTGKNVNAEGAFGAQDNDERLQYETKRDNDSSLMDKPGKKGLPKQAVSNTGQTNDGDTTAASGTVDPDQDIKDTRHPERY